MTRSWRLISSQALARSAVSLLLQEFFVAGNDRVDGDAVSGGVQDDIRMLISVHLLLVIFLLGPVKEGLKQLCQRRADVRWLLENWTSPCWPTGASSLPLLSEQPDLVG